MADVSASTAAAPAAPRPSFGQLFALRDFRFFWGAYAATGTADFFTYVALAWVTLDLTHSGAWVAAVVAVETIFRTAILMVGGAVVDRASPRSVMLRASVGRTLLTAIIAALVLARLITPWMLFPAAVLLGLIGGMFMPARGSAMPAVVGDPSFLEVGNGALQVTQQVAGLAGPVLAGAVVAWRGSGAAFAIDAFAYGLAAVCVALMHTGRPVPAAEAERAERKHLFADIVEGLRTVWNDVPLRAVLIILAAINFCSAGPLDVGLPVLARFEWGSAAYLGLVLSAFGVGAAAGALVVGVLPRRPPLVVVVVGICFWLALGLAGLGLVGAWPAVAVGAVTGLGVGFVNVIGISWIQRRAPAGKLGRVMGLMTMSAMALTPVSIILAGPLVTFSPAVLFVSAGVLLVLVGLGSLASRELRAA